MKNWEMKFIADSGILNLTSHSLDAAHAYKVVSFKTRVRNAVDALAKAQEAFLKEAGIDDPQAFDARRTELNKKEIRKLTKAEAQELTDLNAKMERFNQLTLAQMNEDANIEPKAMPYDQWKALQDENKDIKAQGVELLTLCEAQLEGILWKAPEE